MIFREGDSWLFYVPRLKSKWKRQNGRRNEDNVRCKPRFAAIIISERSDLYCTAARFPDSSNANFLPKLQSFKAKALTGFRAGRHLFLSFFLFLSLFFVEMKSCEERKKMMVARKMSSAVTSGLNILLTSHTSSLRQYFHIWSLSRSTQRTVRYEREIFIIWIFCAGRSVLRYCHFLINKHFLWTLRHEIRKRLQIKLFECAKRNFTLTRNRIWKYFYINILIVLKAIISYLSDSFSHRIVVVVTTCCPLNPFNSLLICMKRNFASSVYM